MLKRIAKVCIAISLVLMMFVIILLSVGAFSGNRRWLEREYEKLDINRYTGMSTEDQCRAFMQMVDFMKGKTDTMDVKVTVDGEEMLMYNEREISHMHDVRNLYRGLNVFKFCACAFMLLTVVLGVIAFRRRADTLSLLNQAAEKELDDVRRRVPGQYVDDGDDQRNERKRCRDDEQRGVARIDKHVALEKEIDRGERYFFEPFLIHARPSGERGFLSMLLLYFALVLLCVE